MADARAPVDGRDARKAREYASLPLRSLGLGQEEVKPHHTNQDITIGE